MQKVSMDFSWAALFSVVFIWSVLKPADYFIWFLEVFPALLGAFILMLTRRRFPLTPLVYVLILLHCIVLMVGGHYTYAEVPLFDWLSDIFDWRRNHYDKLGHFIQGFVPAMIAREIFIRRSPLESGKWLFFFVICTCLAISAFYELIEWWVAVASGSSADAFLGTQGYEWDTQSDMALALLGAIAAQLTLSRLQDKQIKSVL